MRELEELRHRAQVRDGHQALATAAAQQDAMEEEEEESERVEDGGDGVLPDNAPAIIRPAVDTQPASQPRAHPRPSASSPSPSPFYLVAPASVPAVTHSRAHARSWCQRHSHCSSHPGAVYARAG
eukprot:COSAG01_NODE_2063_length_8512_cov_7.924284_1_plen_124_part_10